MKFFRKSPRSGQATARAPSATITEATPANATAAAAASDGVFTVPVLPPAVAPPAKRRAHPPSALAGVPATSPPRAAAAPSTVDADAVGGSRQQQPHGEATRDLHQAIQGVQFRSASEEYNYRQQLLLLQQQMGGGAGAAAFASAALASGPVDRTVRFDDELMTMMSDGPVETTRHHRAVVLPDSMRSASGGPQPFELSDSSFVAVGDGAAGLEGQPVRVDSRAFIADVPVAAGVGAPGKGDSAPTAGVDIPNHSSSSPTATVKDGGAKKKSAADDGAKADDDKSRGVVASCVAGVRNVIDTIVEIAGGRVADRPPPTAGDDPGGDFRGLHLVLVLDNPFDSDNEEGDLLVDELSFVGVDPAALLASDPMNPAPTAVGEGTVNGAQALNGSANHTADDKSVATFLQDDDFLLEPDIDKSAIGAVVGAVAGAAVGAVGTVFDGARAVVRRTGKGLTSVKDVITNKKGRRKKKQRENGYTTAAEGDVEAAEVHEPGSDGDDDRSSSSSSSGDETSAEKKKKEKEKKKSTKLKTAARPAPTKYQKIIEMLLRFRARGIQVIPNDALGTVSETDPDFDPGDPNRFHGYRLIRDRLFESPQKDELYFAIFAPRAVLLKYAEEHSLHLRTNPYSYAGGGAMAYSDALEAELAESVRRYAAAYPIANEFLSGGGNNTNANTLRLRELERRAEKKRLAKEEKRRKKAERKAAAAAAKAERRSKGLAVSSSSSGSSSEAEKEMANNNSNVPSTAAEGDPGVGQQATKAPHYAVVIDATPAEAPRGAKDDDVSDADGRDDDVVARNAMSAAEEEEAEGIAVNAETGAAPRGALGGRTPQQRSRGNSQQGPARDVSTGVATGAAAWGFQLAAPQRTRLNMRLIREGWLFGGCGLQLDVLKSREIFVRNFFVLHNVKYQYQHKLKEWASVRYLLFHPWTVFRQDEVSVVNYFGEYVGLYFVLLHEFTLMLCWPAVIGTIFGIIDDAGISREIIGALMSVMIVLWSVAWIQWWTRREAEFNATWAMDVEAEQEMVRDEYRVVDKHALAANDIYELNFTVPLSLRRRPDGQMIELVYPNWKRLVYRYLVAYPVILLLTAAMLAAFVFNTNWRFDNVDDSDIAFASSIISNAISWVFGFIFGLIVPKLNDMENNRTQAEEENQFIIKSFFFNFFSNYFAMFIIALWPNLDGQQGVTNAARVAQMRTQMFATFITDPLIGLGQEFFLDRVFVFFRRRFDRAGNAVKGVLSLICCGCFEDMVPPAGATKRQRMSFRLWQEARRQPHESTADDMLQIVIQFGYMGMFAPVFPYAPVCTLAWCIIQRAVDAGKLLDAYQRPMAHARQSLGAWNSIFLVLVVCSIITNTYFVSVLSEAPRAVGLPLEQEHKYLYFILFQYMILAVILVMVVVTRGRPDLVQRLITRAQLLRDKAVQSRVQRTLVQKAKSGGGGSVARRGVVGSTSGSAPPSTAGVAGANTTRAVFGAPFVAPDAAVASAVPVVRRAATTEPYGHDESYEHYHHKMPTAVAEQMPD